MADGENRGSPMYHVAAACSSNFPADPLFEFQHFNSTSLQQEDPGPGVNLVEAISIQPQYLSNSILDTILIKPADSRETRWRPKVRRFASHLPSISFLCKKDRQSWGNARYMSPARGEQVCQVRCAPYSWSTFSNTELHIGGVVWRSMCTVVEGSANLAFHRCPPRGQ